MDIRFLPDIEFVPFQPNVTEKDLVEYMSTHYDESVFLVHLRCRYEHDKNGSILQMRVVYAILMTFCG